jgi:hypothetical protein
LKTKARIPGESIEDDDAIESGVYRGRNAAIVGGRGQTKSEFLAAAREVADPLKAPMSQAIARRSCGSRHRRTSNARPVRRRGSRRSSASAARGDPDDLTEPPSHRRSLVGGRP